MKRAPGGPGGARPSEIIRFMVRAWNGPGRGKGPLGCRIHSRRSRSRKGARCAVSRCGGPDPGVGGAQNFSEKIGGGKCGPSEDKRLFRRRTIWRRIGKGGKSGPQDAQVQVVLSGAPSRGNLADLGLHLLDHRPPVSPAVGAEVEDRLRAGVPDHVIASRHLAVYPRLATFPRHQGIPSGTG